ncbi:MAG: ABC-F family ATP-binding cassette domain-containing protein [bacterium]|nr:ABC-F family ATP-binding cassette domain-containing protein [bacterium]
MVPLISARDLTFSYGTRTLFEGVSLTVGEQDRIGIIGPNGSGKTTLLSLLAGVETPESGTIQRRKDLRVAYVPQENTFDPNKSVVDIVASEAAQNVGTRVEDETERLVRVSTVISRMGFVDSEQKAGELSGGWRKRLAIASALACDPDVLMLDEPTNHLDLQGILWLEKLLVSSKVTNLIISHDRTFLEQVAGRIFEVAPRYPGGFFAAEGTYSKFLVRREEFLAARAQYQESLANRVRRELEWLSRGSKARTTKAQSRVQGAERLQEELAEMKANEPGQQAGIEMFGSGRKTKRLLVAGGIAKAVGDRNLFSELDLILQPKLKLGIVGANGSGKSTLLRLLAGEIEPDRGWLKRAQNLKVVYFDQNREQIEPGISLREALAGDVDTVVYRDREIHVVTWAKRFQFRVDQLDLPVSELSGGERARVHIARMMLLPADVLLLDKPTNDLDIPTLEVLEESLLDFPGALVLVTHDRMLLDRVAGVLVGLTGDGQATFFADAAQWQEAWSPAGKKRGPKTKGRSAGTRTKKSGGLTYLEKKEFAGIEQAILDAEAELEEASAALEAPAVASDADRAQSAFLAHQSAKEKVDGLYLRWTMLEEKRQPD